VAINGLVRALFAEPNPEQGEAEFWTSAVLIAGLNGFVYVEKVRARDGTIVQVADPTNVLTARRAEMLERTARRTVPQIYIGETHVGGCDELIALDRAGKLLPLLAGACV